VSKKGEVEIINVPHAIRLKVSGGGAISEAMLKKANQVIEEMTASFVAVLRVEIDKMAALSEDAKTAADKSALVEQIFEVSHDLRGQASTFDFPLVTRIGSSLCRFVEAADLSDTRAQEVIDAHINSMKLVVVQDLRGDGGAAGQKIATGLEIAAKKVLG
jgi:chemotaxis protein histidine kinase CheA